MKRNETIKGNDTGLTQRELDFCEMYLSPECLCNGLKAYQMTHPDSQATTKTQYRKMRELLQKEHVQNYIRKVRAERKQQDKITEEEVLDSAIKSFNIALEGKPTYRLNLATKKMEVVGTEVDVRALNDSIRLVACLIGMDISGRGKREETATVKIEANDKLLEALKNVKIEGVDDDGSVNSDNE